MPVLSQIVAWSRERPQWQQDALRRLTEQSRLTAQDLAAIVDLCKSEAGLEAEPGDPARGLDDATTLASADRPPVVHLTSVHSLENVNVLRDDQTLNIAPAGLTVVYGDNGAGKTGYVRVLKQLCRARGARDSIHSNVYSDASEPTLATVCFEVEAIAVDTGVATTTAETSAAPAAITKPLAREIVWSPGVRGPDDLAQVSVFDSKSASVYVTEENAVAYLPFGTDLFPRLVSVVQTVREALEREIGDIDRARDRFESIPLGTKVYDVLSNLHAEGARQRVDQLAEVDDTERVQLDDLRAEHRRLQADDPTTRATECRRCAARLDGARARLAKLEAAVSASSISELKELRYRLNSARKAAELASSRAFADAPIKGVGTDVWRSLWLAARKFAEEGQAPPRPFPIGPSADPRCVLCQQPLIEDAAGRMLRFDEFVQGETQAQVDVAFKALQARLRELGALDPGGVADKVLLDEIEALDASLVPIITTAVSQVTVCRNAAVDAARAEEAPADWDVYVHGSSDAQGRLGTLSQHLRDNAVRFEAAADPGARRRVEDAIRELEARLALGGLRERVYAEIQRQNRRTALQRALATATTTGITRRNTEILKEAVTEPLANAFETNIEALKLAYLPIAVAASGGEKGRAFHALALDEKTASRVPMEEVLSEGEHRGVALAAFLAEVFLQESQSTIVFDDPVSSMDHGRREYVARRIVEIATSRPALVFTHDFVFLVMLQRAAETQGIAVHPRYFRRDGQRAGLIDEDWPWDGQAVATRLGALKQMVQGFPGLAVSDRPKYESEVRVFYDRLRTTWERAVEEILFNGAIRRFGREVQTKRLKNLHRLTEKHLADLETGMTRASEWVQAHDHAPDLGLPVPEPAEATADLAALDQWVRDVRKQVQ